MAEYEFRLRFNLAHIGRINADVQDLVLLDLPAGGRLRLRTGKTGEPIKNAERVAVLGGPYTSPEQARTAAERAKSALLFWALEHRLGIDFGDGHPRGVITEAGIADLERRFRGPVRADVHGIDVYESQPNIKFVLVEATAQVGVNLANFVKTFAREFTGGRQLAAKQGLAAEIYSSSFFDASPRSRFITLMTAVEALLEPAARPEHVQRLIEQMEKLAGTAMEVEKETRDSIIGSLQWLKAESIGQAGRILAGRLLSDKNYNNRPASAFFKYCYEIRSNLVHRGNLDPSINPLLLANTMGDFVADLLLASVSQLVTE